jgi:serine/threonine protein kinase
MSKDLIFQREHFLRSKLELPLMTLMPSNKIAEGGFGPVYKVLCKRSQLSCLEYPLPPPLSLLCHNHVKFLTEISVQGQLPDGIVIAVKQLSSKSRQGNREFLNEMGMISCLQHPNLVKLHGCCIESDQLLLVYEYMENNSLARALFRECSSILNENIHLKYYNA